MTFDAKAKSRKKGQPVTTYLFQGDVATELQLENLLRSVTVIPGTTEFGYATTMITKTDSSGPENYISNRGVSDFSLSLDQLIERAPNLKHVSLVVAWHGDDLRVGECKIKPRVEKAVKPTSPWSWQVGPVTRGSATLVSFIGPDPAFGGAPSDRSVYEAIVRIKARGLKVTLYPFIMMDIPAGNTLTSPYGGAGQSVYPWRGRITCHPAAGQPGTVDKTAAAATQVNAFFGNTVPAHFGWDATNKVVTYSGSGAEWSFRRFILHLATIADGAGGVDDFLLGSELIGITTIRSNANTYPAVSKLIDLAADVRGIVGAGTRISYAADWSEYHSHRPSDGSNDVFFHLDPLWASAEIDFVGIDNYLPISDWRDTNDHLDLFTGARSIYDLDYLQKGIESGEYYDWYYLNDTDRTNQVRTPITDGAGKPWVFRNKDVRNWWLNAHYNRPSGVESASPTAWTAQSKPIVFTELGCPAVNKGSNQPNVFVDPKSSESDLPHFSDGNRDELMLRAALEAWLTYFSGANNPTSTQYAGTMIDIDALSLWTWDARPSPAFPRRNDYWSDADNWHTGHWLNGRLKLSNEPVGKAQVFAYTDTERAITVAGQLFSPKPIRCGNMNASGKLDKSMLEVRMPRDVPLAELFRVYPPSQPITLVIRQGHLTDEDSEFLAVWAGRVLSMARDGNEAVFACEPLSSSLRRTGLRRHYQIGCPHVLYGDSCKANKTAATRNTTVSSISNNNVTLPTGWNGAFAVEKFTGGAMEWTTPEGTKEIRTILSVSGNVLRMSGFLRGLTNGYAVKVVLGCNHKTSDCRDLHNSILNYGGCPTIPVKNPMSPAANQFF
jgi:hypothetical protein